MDPSIQHDVIHWEPKANQTVHHQLIGEEPLSIRVQGKPYSVVMRTPGDELAHAVGFCLGEGIIDRHEDYTSLAFCDGGDTNVVTVTLTPSRREKILPTLERRGYISQTSCGLCGKELVKDLYQIIHPMTDSLTLDVRQASTCLKNLAHFNPCGGRPWRPMLRPFTAASSNCWGSVRTLVGTTLSTNHRQVVSGSQAGSCSPVDLVVAHQL